MLHSAQTQSRRKVPDLIPTRSKQIHKQIREHPGGAQGSEPEWIGLPFCGRLRMSGSESLQAEEK